MCERIEGEKFEEIPSSKLTFSFIGREHGMAIVENMIGNPCFLCFCSLASIV